MHLQPFNPFTNAVVINIDYLQTNKETDESKKICRVRCLSQTNQFTGIFTGSNATVTVLKTIYLRIKTDIASACLYKTQQNTSQS